MVPTSLYSGARDFVADPQDVAELIPKIKDMVRYSTEIPGYEHMDFVWGANARAKVYDNLIADIKKTLDAQ